MRFFFYGTLIAGSGNPAAAVHARLHDLGPATAAGALHAIGDRQGWYPALLPGAGTVHGRLYQAGLDFGRDDMAALDAYEDFDPAAPSTSLYLREALPVTGADGTRCEAQVYRFNQPLPAGTPAIADGDFRAWLARSGLRAYGAVS